MMLIAKLLWERIVLTPDNPFLTRKQAIDEWWEQCESLLMERLKTK